MDDPLRPTIRAHSLGHEAGGHPAWPGHGGGGARGSRSPTARHGDEVDVHLRTLEPTEVVRALSTSLDAPRATTRMAALAALRRFAAAGLDDVTLARVARLLREGTPGERAEAELTLRAIGRPPSDTAPPSLAPVPLAVGALLGLLLLALFFAT